MSYKTRWFNKKEIQKIAKHFGISKVGDLCDRSDTEVFDGAYGGNIENKLRLHPLIVTKKIDDYLSHFDQEIERTQGKHGRGVWGCSCGWTGKGTGRDGRLVEGDRCPDCGTYL